MSEAVVLAGPSHVTRLRFAIDQGETAPPRREVVFHDRPGESVASPFFQEPAVVEGAEDVVLMVGDFRFGNRRLVDDRQPGAYNGIEKDLISRANDRALYADSLAALDRIVEQKPSIRLLFWCLAGRELQNRLEGRYMSGGEYRHPVWNLADVES
ncbi:hypothetical protein E4U02_14880 [Microbacterium paludicola]|uniref:Uncharacterized protein n=1 Tax=Microbacterium paludicola TaxID=300019 RepID=A0A4Y9FMM6_9MICO|nr:hypothetical protein [Microbacterium paludicola]MBF0817689.1 hypothetical protein [Microbacterium paludicola]TFU30276.1 hypothetical protein E4U02_14880 [Microbacterium paludicola]